MTHALARPKVLVVDDSATSCLTLEGHLKDAYEVHVAPNGQAGVQRALAVKPDLIIMDVMMPVMDGHTACRLLREHMDTAATPIIMVTSRDDEWDVEAGWVSGCTDYVIKPADREELLAKIESWLDVSRPVSDAP